LSARAAAASSVGTVKSVSVRGPVIQVIVPSARVPAQFQHLRAEGGDHHRAGRDGRHGDLAMKGEGLAGERHGLAADQRHQDRQVLAHVAGRLLEREAHHRLD